MTNELPYNECKQHRQAVLQALFLLFILTFLTTSILPGYILEFEVGLTEQVEKGEEESKEESETDDYVHMVLSHGPEGEFEEPLVWEKIADWQHPHGDILTPPPERV